MNEQLKAIQRELGNEGEEGEGDEIAELTQKIATLKLSKEAKTKATVELKKLKTMAPMSAEATVTRNYLDVLLGLPWGKKSKLKKDIAAAQAVLDNDHYALEKVKDRIIEYLAVQARTNKLKGPILCLVGPPGVGKTSLGRSIAKATGREFVRQSLGGVRDEAEIRGHRRTYIGSLLFRRCTKPWAKRSTPSTVWRSTRKHSWQGYASFVIWVVWATKRPTRCNANLYPRVRLMRFRTSCCSSSIRTW